MAASLASSLASPPSGLSMLPDASAALAGKAKPVINAAAKAKSAGEDFEAVFLNSMFQQMFSGIGNGPFSGGQGAQVWRSFLTDEYAKTFVKSGGIGLAAQVQRELLTHQEAR